MQILNTSPFSAKPRKEGSGVLVESACGLGTNDSSEVRIIIPSTYTREKL